MKGHGRHLAMLSAVVLAASCIQAQAETKTPLEAFGNIPEFSNPKISPDGKYFAAIQSFRGKPAILIYKLFASPNSVPNIIPSSDWIITDLQWVKNDRLTYFARQGIKGIATGARLYTFGRTFATGVEGEVSIPLMKDQAYLNINTASYVVDAMIDDPDNVLAPLWVPNVAAADQRSSIQSKHDDDFRQDLLKVNVRTGKSEKLYSGSPYTQTWYTDGTGKAIARIDRTTTPLLDRLKVPDGSAWREVATFDATGENGAGIIGLSADGRYLVQYGNNDKGIAGYSQIEIQTGKGAKPLYYHPTFDVERSIRDEWTDRVIGAVYSSTKEEYVYFDPQRQALQRGLEKAFPGLSVQAVSETRDRSKVIVAVDGPQNPLTYYFLDRNTHQADIIAKAYPGLDGVALGEMKQFVYKARDGLDIDAYLTLPPGRAAKNLPLVVMPHGGPDSRDRLQFDWWAQFLVNRGYAVLQPNFRGSSGYGQKFTDAGLVEWGRRMQTDIADGALKLIADAIADPKRVCIVGASYGGYAALAGVTYTPDLYACAVSVAGISSLPDFITDKRIDTEKGSKSLSFWFSRMGSIYQDNKLLHEMSPAEQVDKIKAPVLLMHGEDDSTVRISQSITMRDAMKKAGKKVEFIRFKDDDHYLSLSATRVQMLKEIERFLAENIGQ